MEMISGLLSQFVHTEWVVWATAIVTAAGAITAVTPTPKDDAIVAKAYKVLDWLALNVLKAKDKGDDTTPPAA